MDLSADDWHGLGRRLQYVYIPAFVGLRLLGAWAKPIWAARAHPPSNLYWVVWDMMFLGAGVLLIWASIQVAKGVQLPTHSTGEKNDG